MPMEATPARPARIILIAAVARNGVIGHNNQLLWHLPADLAHFKATTQGAAVLMGRKTWDSLPPRFRPLPGRRNLVLTHQAHWSAPGAETAPSLDAALARLVNEPRVFVIGGEQIYQAALPVADELILTELDRDYAGDAHFPQWNPAEFIRSQPLPSVAAHGEQPGYGFVTYQRIASPRS